MIRELSRSSALLSEASLADGYKQLRFRALTRLAV
jgi:hypothetical protein